MINLKYAVVGLAALGGVALGFRHGFGDAERSAGGAVSFPMSRRW